MFKKIIALSLTVISFSLASAYAYTEKVRVGYYESGAYQVGKNDSESKSGFNYEYLQKIATKTGWDYEYVYGTKDELLESLKNGKIDLLAGVEDSSSSRESLLFPNSPMGEEYFNLYKVNSNTEISIGDIQSIEGKKIGMIFESDMAKFLNNWINSNDIDCEVVFYDSIADQKDAIFSGELDLIVETGSHISLESGLTAVTRVGENRFYLAVTKSRLDLLDKLNTAISSIIDEKPYFLEDLKSRYLKNASGNLGLTDQENRWIDGHPVIRVGFVKEYLPFCDEEKGEVMGILPEVINDILSSMSLSGRISIEYVWDESYWNLFNRLKNGEVDVIFPVYKSLWHSEQLDAFETEAVCPASVDIIYKGNYCDDLTSQIAISQHSPIQKIYAELNYPESEIVWCDNALGCLTSVAKGKAKSTLFSSYRASFFLNQRSFNKLRSFQLSQDTGYAFGVTRNNTILLSILNKGVALLNAERVNMLIYENTNRKMTVTVAQFIYDHPWVFFIVVMIIGMVIIVAVMWHSHTVNQVAEQLKKNLEVVDCLASDFTNVYMINLKDETFSVLKMKGYSPAGIEEDRKIVYPYTKFMNKYVNLRVFGMDSMQFSEMVDIDYVRTRLSTEKEYSHEYRVFDDAKIHYYKFKYINLGEPGKSDTVILGFSNIDDVVRSAQEREVLKQRAELDGLTQTANRGYGESAGRQMIFNGMNGLFLILDIDKFKEINDTYGHQAGDKVLVGVASCLKNTFFQDDLIIRLGGDEFMVISPNISERERAEEVLNSFTERVKSLDLYELDGHRVSVSVGAVMTTSDKRNFDDYYALADSCVYESKKIEGCSVTFSK